MTTAQWSCPALALIPDAPGPQPKVTVAVTVYNGERYLARTLESLLAQQFTDFEVLCGDDCSTDRSAAILADFQARDSRVRVFRTPRNLGMSPRVMNFLLDHARGSYLAYSSQDDLFSEDWLSEMVRRAEETGADAVVPNVEFFHENSGQNVRQVGLCGDLAAELAGREALAHSLDWSVSGFALWRLDIVRRVGFDDFAVNADEFTTRRLFLECRKVAFSDGIFFYRQDNTQAVTKRLSLGAIRMPLTHLKLSRLLLQEDFPYRLSEAEVLRCVSSVLWYGRRLGGGEGLRSLSLRDRMRGAGILLGIASELTASETRGQLWQIFKSGSPVARAKIATILVAGFVARLR